jgi:hydrogenase maturation protein HypF
MLLGEINLSRTSSAGRLFDAVASILNLCQVTCYESQAAMRVEEAAIKADTPGKYPYHVTECRDGGCKWVLDWEPMIVGILADQRRHLCVAQIAAKFHSTLAAAIAEIARRYADETGNNRVLLSGGCFQNRLLLTESIAALKGAGLIPFRHHRIPPNDGGISAGQAAAALARWRAGEE